MATNRTNPSKPVVEKSKLLKVAEKVGTIAGTVVGKKNQLVRKAEIAIEKAKEKVTEFAAKKKGEVKAAVAKTRQTAKASANAGKEVTKKKGTSLKEKKD